MIGRISGRVTATHRGGQLAIEAASELKLNTRGSTVVLKDIKGEAVMQVQAGELRGESLAGPVEIESNGTRITLEDLTGTRRPIRVNASSGSVTMTGLRTDTRIDGRDTRIDVTIDQPAPVAIYNEAEEPMDVTLPAGGFQLDALATDGRLTVPEGLADVKTAENEQRATGRRRGRRSHADATREARKHHDQKETVRAIARDRLRTSHFPLPTSDFPLPTSNFVTSRFKIRELHASDFRTSNTSDFRLQTSDFLL